jgi:plasmid rolling circle replication initiator protein Rep
MEKNKDRFVNIDEIKELMRQRDEIEDTLIKEINNKINSYNQFHCQFCGDTTPKHGFSALLSGGYPIRTSPYRCNKCSTE